MAGHYTDQKFPGVGASIGLSRLFYVLDSNGLIKEQADVKNAPVDVAIIPLGEPARKTAFELAEKLRAKNQSVDVVLVDKKLGDIMKHAAKIAKSGIVIGDDEVASGRFLAKDFSTGKASPLEI